VNQSLLESFENGVVLLIIAASIIDIVLFTLIIRSRSAVHKIRAIREEEDE
jgi:hypothetical protein